MVASNGSLKVRHPGMIQFEKVGIVRLESVVPSEIGLDRLSGMMRPEDFRCETPHGLSKKSIYSFGGYPVKDEILGLLSRSEL